MHSLSRAKLAAAALLVSLAGIAAAQTTALGKQLSRVTFGISGAGEFNNTVSGTVIPTGAPDCYLTPSSNTGPCTNVLTQFGSNTVGAMATIRYVAKPYIGIEFNYGWARYTQNFSSELTSVFQVQNTANEYTLGYVINPPHPIFGFQPFLAVGAGSTEFKPTGGGGEGEPKQARATYYYNVGLEKQFGETPFGMRASFRELFFLYPDFGQNYLTIKQRGTTYQPTVGFFARF
jgi:hypothetical protein